jgi:hypothetical protein
VELRYTEVWTRTHLGWFNVDFDSSSYHSIPSPLQRVEEPAPENREEDAHGNLHDSESTEEELLTELFSIANEYRE